MFDVGFSELFVIAVVALLVLGPERLPRAARLVGLWVRRARAHWFAVQSELESELAADELRRSLRATQDELRAAQAQLMSGDAMHGAMPAARVPVDAATHDAPRAPEPLLPPDAAASAEPPQAAAAPRDEH